MDNIRVESMNKIKVIHLDQEVNGVSLHVKTVINEDNTIGNVQAIAFGNMYPLLNKEVKNTIETLLQTIIEENK